MSFSTHYCSSHGQIDKPLQRHGGRLEHNETYCGSCYGAESVSSFLFFVFFFKMSCKLVHGFSLFDSCKWHVNGSSIPF